MTPFITRLRFSTGRIVFSSRRTCHPPRHHGSGRQLHQYPYKTAGFLFFILLHKEDAKKTDDSVMKVRGCIIDVHEDINNLPSLTKQPLVVVHHIVIVLQCLIISWES